ncbi:hypothetical protein ACHAWF_004898 [Thalassiosira exigua]
MQGLEDSARGGASSVLDRAKHLGFLDGGSNGDGILYRERDLSTIIPTEDSPQYKFTPSKFDGPRTKSKRFHNIARFGYTDDITSLVSFRRKSDSDGSGSSSKLGNASSAPLSFGGELLSTNHVPKLSDKEYNSKDASDYVRGIASVGICILLVYIVWGAWMLLVRMGRMDCCFRLCNRGGRRLGKDIGKEDREEAEGNDDDGDDVFCCYACHESLAAKGGCCARHVFCGWMSGRPVRLPTRSSLVKERELRNKRLIKNINVVPKRGSEEHPSFGVANGDDAKDVKDCHGGRLPTAQPAETAVAGATRSNGKSETETNERSTNVDHDCQIDEAYILNRQQAARRTILALRIIFLLASASTITASCVLIAKGWSGVNDIINSSKNTLRLVEGQLEGMLDGVEQYIETSKRVKENREQFFSRTRTEVGLNETATGDNGNSGLVGGWCPAVMSSGGKVEVVVPLAQLLLQGRLIKLAFVDAATEVAEHVTDGAQNIANGVKEAADEIVDQSTVADGIAQDEAQGAEEVTNGVVRNLKEVTEGISGQGIAGGAMEAVITARDKTVTVITFLDALNPDQIIAKVFGLKDIVSNAIGDSDKIEALVERLKQLVKTLVVRAVSNIEGTEQRMLQQTAEKLLQEYVIMKDGVNYTVVELVDGSRDFIGNEFELVYGSYNLTNLFTNNITLTLDVANLTDNVRDRLGKVSQRMLGIFVSLRDGLNKAYVQSQDAQTSLDSILPYFYVAVAFVSLIILLTLTFAVGVALAWKEKQPRLFRHMQDCVLVPVFIVCGLLCWVFTVIFLTLGVLAGDFCVDSPDVQVTKILEQNVEGISKIAYNFGYFYGKLSKLYLVRTW